MSKDLIHSVRAMTDKVLEGKETAPEAASRRVWLQNFGLMSASAAVMWACGDSGGNNAVAQAPLTQAQLIADAGTYNVALGLEHEAIAIYTAAAGLDVWDASITPLAPAFLEIALAFVAHHTSHRDAIIAKINENKASTLIEPVSAKTTAEYLTPYPGIASLSGASGLLAVLQVAAEREANAANAYFSVLTSFNDSAAIPVLGGLSADEAAHYGVLNAAAFAFGALSNQASGITAANIVSGALPPFVYSKSGVRA